MLHHQQLVFSEVSKKKLCVSVLKAKVVPTVAEKAQK